MVKTLPLLAALLSIGCALPDESRHFPESRDIAAELWRNGAVEVGSWRVRIRRNEMTDSVEAVSATNSNENGDLLELECRRNILALTVYSHAGWSDVAPVRWRIDSLPIEEDKWGLFPSWSREEDIPGLIRRLRASHLLRFQNVRNPTVASFMVDSLWDAATPVVEHCGEKL
jgi:hypothetical protein